MKHETLWVTTLILVGHVFIAPSHTAEPSRCERLFLETAAVATCNSISSIHNSLTDEELRERVSQSVYGESAEQTALKSAKHDAQKRRMEIEVRAALEKEHQCFRLFSDLIERDACRTLRMLTLAQIDDDSMREQVRTRLTNNPSDDAQRQAAGVSEERFIRQEVEARRSKIAHEAHLAAAEDKRRITEVERRQREATAEEAGRKAAIAEEKRRILDEQERKRAARDAEVRHKKNEEVINARLKKGEIGFIFSYWEKGGFGTVLLAHFILQNNTSSPKKDFRLVCDTRGGSGTLLGRPSATLYERLEPSMRRTFSLNVGVIHSQTANVSCDVAHWVSG